MQSPVNNSPAGCGWSPGGTVPNSPHSPEQQLSAAAVSAPINMNQQQQQQIFFPNIPGGSPIEAVMGGQILGGPIGHAYPQQQAAISQASKLPAYFV